MKKANFRKIVRYVRKFDVKCRDILENGRFEVSDDSCSGRKKRGEDGRIRGRRHLFTKITQPPKLAYHSISMSLLLGHLYFGRFKKKTNKLFDPIISEIVELIRELGADPTSYSESVQPLTMTIFPIPAFPSSFFLTL